MTTRDVVMGDVEEGGTGWRLPSARVWDKPGRMPPGAYRRLMRGDPCCYCGEPVEPDEPRNNPRAGTVEHVERKADGGVFMEGNIVGACRECNRGRDKATVLEWLLTQRTGLTKDDLVATR